MRFNSFGFLFVFLPLTLSTIFVLGALGWRRAAKAALVGASFVFYGWDQPLYVLLLLSIIIFTFEVGRALARFPVDEAPRGRLALFVVGLLGNLGTLVYFKYASVLVASAQSLGFGWHLAHVILPIGLSFIAFQNIAFLVDGYTGSVGRFAFLDFCIFEIFFPKLISGPIVHYREMIPQLEGEAALRYDSQGFTRGLAMLAVGLGKKLLVADSIAPFVGTVFGIAAQGEPVGLARGWTAAVTYVFQLYFDFSGYCDMAVGIGWLFNVHLPVNFNSPLKADNIIDFWRRWNITLTRILTGYVYTPWVIRLTRARAARGISPSPRGGMTVAAFTQLVGLPTLVTMTLVGIWHGAGLQFVLFGVLHGGYLVVNHAWRTFVRKPSPSWEPLPWIVTFAAVVVSCVFFRAASAHDAFALLADLGGRHGLGNWQTLGVPVAAIVLLGAAVLVLPNSQELVGEPLREVRPVAFGSRIRVGADRGAPGAAVAALRRHGAGIALVAGLAVGYTAAVAAGWRASDAVLFPDFVRLHKFIGGETLFFPTASQMRAVVRSQCPSDRTLVLVAGNSVFNGFGQRTQAIWTKLLQADLGGDYCVVNLATALSLPGDFGAVITNMLWTEYPRLVLVMNILPGRCGPPDGSPVYRYLFWDAYWKGLLTDAKGPRRAIAAESQEPDAPTTQEVRSHTYLNSLFRFDDLWTFVTYRWASTVWTFDTSDAFPAPRCSFPDPVPEILPIPGRFEIGRQPSADTIAQYSSPFFDSDGAGAWIERFDVWKKLMAEVDGVMPAAFRPRTLIVMTELNPWHLRKLSAAQRTRHTLLYDAAVLRWLRAGYETVTVGRDFAPEDYLDLGHLTESGGQKLERAIAPRVRELADRNPRGAP